MARKFTLPPLADISQDIAGNIPLDVIKNWTEKRKTKKLHVDILKKFSVKGTVVVSDSAGLSKITRERSLVEVMKLVSHPKEIIFREGSKIGGRAIGVWAADNTQMYYPDTISCHNVVNAMKRVQKELKNNELQVGIAIHCGEFLEIGGGLFGEDAELVEEIAENKSVGGEIIFTDKLKNELGKKRRVYAKAVIHEVGHYPYPFSDEFYEDIKNGRMDNNKYLTNKVVVLVRVFHGKQEFLLDELTQWILANTIVTTNALRLTVYKIKSNGSLGIFVSDNVKHAIEFAKRVRENLVTSGFVVNVAIAKGEVLIFDLKESGMEIAGEAVNITSKLAEDCSERNSIIIEESVKTKQSRLALPFEREISRVIIKGVRF